MITVPHFTLLLSLKLLVCTEKKGLATKGRKDTKIGGWICLERVLTEQL